MSDMTSSHSEKEIYEGCIALMKDITKMFYEYLSVVGVNVEDIPDDEQFYVAYYPTEIVERLFLRRTSHSGRMSQLSKCKELEIDPYDEIEFSFDDFRSTDN